MRPAPPGDLCKLAELNEGIMSVRDLIPWARSRAVEADRRRMEEWQSYNVEAFEVEKWADSAVTESWGKKAAARVFHICDKGRDVEFDNLFAPGKATKKSVRYLDRVPGSPECAKTKYDVAQALSYVASHRNNVEERVAQQLEISQLLQRLR
jgi:hypothetical protein